MTMTLERALDVLRVVTSRAMQGSETRDAYDCVVSHLTQSAQSVDVKKVREVITELNSFPASDKQIRWANKLAAALQDKTP